MRVQDIVRNACPICGKEITLAAIEPHPTHSERELHTYRVWIADRSKPRPFDHVRVD